jgi:hypothetical protein
MLTRYVRHVNDASDVTDVNQLVSGRSIGEVHPPATSPAERDETGPGVSRCHSIAALHTTIVEIGVLLLRELQHSVSACQRSDPDHNTARVGQRRAATQSLELQPGAGGNHWWAAGVDGVDHLAGVDSLQIDARDPEVAVS